MALRVDQSIKIEQTSNYTVLALSNDEQFTIVIPAQVKRKALAFLRRRGWYGRRAILACFAAGLFLLLKRSKVQFDLIVVDQEYEGHERDIKSVLLRHLRSTGIKIPAEAISFRQVGKHSKVHRLAWAVCRGKRTPDHIVTLNEFLDAV
jgi:hypothetical protein